MHWKNSKDFAKIPTKDRNSIASDIAGKLRKEHEENPTNEYHFTYVDTGDALLVGIRTGTRAEILDCKILRVAELDV